MTTPGNSRALSDSSRRLKGYTYSDDRISNLPDHILEHILSFLPTKNAVATGILSKAWKDLWTTAVNLDFSYTDFDPYLENPDLSIPKFVQFVNYVLHHPKRGYLNKLSLIWNEGFDRFYVNGWISVAVTDNVHELSVFVEDCALKIQVQRRLFSCQELQSLILNCKINIFSKVLFSLPKLESLKLISVYFKCFKAFSKLLAGCPVLKYLSIDMSPYVYQYFIDHTYIDIILTQVPRIMFSCEGLQSLELNSRIEISPETVIPLPKLKSLKLVSVYFQCEEAFSKLIACCPVLKYLYIHTRFGNHQLRDDGSVFRYIVSSNSLRHLELYVHAENADADSDYGYNEDSDPDDEGTSLCNVELAAPSLVYIKLKDEISSIFIPESLNSLVEANIQLAALESRPDYCNLFVEAFGAFHWAETLTLSRHVIWALKCATVDLTTRFERLSKLEVTIPCCDWSLLQDLLKLSDNLEVLTVNKGGYLCDQCINWKKPNQVPNCLSNSLKIVTLYGYKAGDDELAKVAYILKHGSALKVMKICLSIIPITDYKRKFEVVQQITKFPRKSPVCEVEVS